MMTPHTAIASWKGMEDAPAGAPPNPAGVIDLADLHGGVIHITYAFPLCGETQNCSNYPCTNHCL